MTDAVVPSPCADCGQPAVVALGTTALCQRCKWEVQAAIFTRRPDLRSPTGIGVPTGGNLVDDGLPVLRCDVCRAGWPGTPFMDCPWCLEREEWLVVDQARMERERFYELVGRIRDGDVAAIAPAVPLAHRLGLEDLLARTAAQMPEAPM